MATAARSVANSCENKEKQEPPELEDPKNIRLGRTREKGHVIEPHKKEENASGSGAEERALKQTDYSLG